MQTDRLANMRTDRPAALLPGQRIGLFGGTFDPPHHAHLQVAHAAADAAGLDAVWLVPSGMPALKRLAGVSMPVYRYEMARAACAHDGRLICSDIELRRAGPSYTLDTVAELGGQTADPHAVYLIGGTDILFDLPDWHQPAALLRRCTLLIGTRPGFSPAAVSAQIRRLEQRYGAVIQTFEMPPMDISSTAIRTALRASSEAEIPVPPAVADVIRRYRIYEDAGLLRFLRSDTLADLNRYQQILWRRMSRRRLLHSVSTAMCALRLALRFGADPDDAVIAGVLHDACKETTARHWRPAEPEDAANFGDYPKILHGPAAAEFIRTELGISSSRIADAVRYHTTLRPGAGILEKIIYLSDKIEASRIFMDLAPIRAAAETDLNRAVYLCLSAVHRMMTEKGQPGHPLAIGAMRSLETAPAIPAIRKDAELDYSGNRSNDRRHFGFEERD